MKPTTFETTNTLADLGWDDLVREGEYYSSVEWLDYFRELHPGYQAYAATLSDGRVVAGMALHEVDVDSHPLNRPDLFLADRLATEGPEAEAQAFRHQAAARLMPTLSLGGRTPGTTAFLHDPGASDQEYGDLLEAVLDQAERVAAERGLRSVTLPYVDDPRMRAMLVRRGYVVCGTETDSMISLSGRSSFDEYVDGLAPRPRRQIRSDRRKIDAAGWTYEVIRLEEAPLKELCRLQTMNADQHGVPGGFEEAVRKHELVMKLLPGRSWVAIGRDPNGLIGACAFFIRWRDELYSRQTGVDQSLTKGCPIFYETTYYQLIEHGISVGASSIHYSVTSAHGKKLRGCVQRMQECFTKCLDDEDQNWLKPVAQELPEEIA
ncbi:peptidogalycan biosysnthesis protein [Streptomyces sp. NPDC048409]|uniref:peptidogalycan biosysnthesis protein n=1 Tax=Streptomyces sp. NPDC048409 TaxID=3154723 RepID=UPI00341C9C29